MCCISKEAIRPENCNYPPLAPRHRCVTLNRNNPNCDCRWCVYNREFCKANRIPQIQDV